jgi:hypothetical protein
VVVEGAHDRDAAENTERAIDGAAGGDGVDVRVDKNARK